MNDNFAAGLAPALRQGIQALGMAPMVREQAKLTAGVQAAQAAKAGTDAELNRYRLNKMQDPATAAQLEQIATGLGVLHGTGGDIGELVNGAKGMQQVNFRNQVLGNIGDPGTDRGAINLVTSMLEGKAYEPYSNIGETGAVLDKGTGAIGVANPGMAAIFGRDAAASAGLKEAQARDAGKKWDATRGGTVDVATNTFHPAQVAGGGELPKPNDPSRKPLPSVALKMQQETLEAMGLVGGINADLGSIQQQVRDGELDLGPIANKVSEGLNWAGNSTKNSRAYASFMSTLEKLRNDSLRLNKGVPTEGDAQRAWNELLANINDPQLVEQRLGEVIAINQRAAELRGLANDSIRANFGHDPMDYSQYLNLRPAVGRGNASANPGPLSYPTVSARAADALRQNPDRAAEFDAKFGSGAAAKILGN